MEDVDLAGIEVIDHDRRFIKQARKEVEAQADKMLDTGMDTQVKLSCLFYILCYEFCVKL